MSFDPDVRSDEDREAQLSIEDLLELILKELQKMNIHLGIVTDEEVTDEEIEDGDH